MSESISAPDQLVTPLELNPEAGKEPFLRFHLSPQTTALLPLCCSVEVLNIFRKEIVPIFFMPAWVTGVYNFRGEILWMIDLGHLLGLMPYHHQPAVGANVTTIVLNGALNNVTNDAAHSMANIKAHNAMLGCIVSQLEAIEYCDTQQIQPTNAATLPFVQGYWLKPNQEMLPVLDVAAILSAMPHTRR